jgi:serine/threonine-protein kinase
VSGKRAGLPAALDAVIARGMAKDPADRFPSGAALASACAEALGLLSLEPAGQRVRGPGAEDPPIASPRTALSD